MIKAMYALFPAISLAVILSSLIDAPCRAEDARIEVELKDSAPIVNPLRYALGDAEYEKAMKSGQYSYTGNLKCRLCHRDFFMGRKHDAHEHTFIKSLGDKYANQPRCLPCHSTGYGVDTGFKNLKETPKLADVQCEGCHGPGSLHNSINDKGGFLAGTDHPERLMKMCRACHNSRWDKSFKELKAAFNGYKEAEAKASGK